ncbi:pseudaminic acid biosynthesis-associated protein PseG [Salinisphaera shabanensis T35B1]
MSDLGVHWLVVDHYSLDIRWESRVRRHVANVLVLDDLADRQHQAEILLDQNLGREAKDYARLVPPHCELLIGPQYAVLRPEFALTREESLRRRDEPRLKKLLVTMGGMDKDNVTGKVLYALRGCSLPDDFEIDVVMGSNAPWLENVRVQAGAMPRPTRVLVDIQNMAERMAEADLAVGAAGSTSWERCCLGLPTLIVTLAENQYEVAYELHELGAARLLDVGPLFVENLRDTFEQLDAGALRTMSVKASEIANGEGLDYLVAKILSTNPKKIGEGIQ